ncbi:hypothetical protein ACFV4I_08935 [Nocardiopsis alba]|uniref:Uncharacterized protein n=1 Tax=Nocardiopsis alba (strain ATCC BAA-2165 / BE74) TaxID=1205910 RepID=J7L1I7_NOCAA|nr:hypothetical protein [Nocardiopsis alba]AFR06601.1 hypothetical protein B005_3416 [Nocardiopsis alba ATCC BAA-2165]
MNITHKAWAKIISLLTPPEADTKEKGAGFVEYAAIIVFVGIIAALLYNSNIGSLIVQGISNSVSSVLNP